MVSNSRGVKKYKIIIGLLAGLLVVVMGTGSLHLYDYTENDPEFCLNCHLDEGCIPQLGNQCA